MRFSKSRKLLLFLLDISIISGCYFLISLLLGSRNINQHYMVVVLQHLLLIGLCYSVSLFAFKMYDSLWRYAESQEYLTLIISVAAAFCSYRLMEALLPLEKLPAAVGITAASLSSLSMLLVRFSYRQYRNYKKLSHARHIRLAIVGAGSAGATLLNNIQSNADSNYLPVCFFDDNPVKIGKRIHGVSIVGPVNMVAQYCKTHYIQELIIAMPSINSSARRKVISECARAGCDVKILPDTVLLLENKYDILEKTIRHVNIQDLLGRESVTFDCENVHYFLKDKVVMVTGGGGSIGSQLCKQVMQCAPKRLVVIDIYENNVYDLQQELLLDCGKNIPLSIEIASVRDVEKLDSLFDKYRPQVVFHAAAHKHVPLMELCPEEAVKNNIFGTYHMVQMADRYRTEKFVLISTDKAVNPTNIMGATKRFCEMILQSMKGVSQTQFVAVRFGNVLGSNGSVIPLFKRQIERGGPVTVTHKDIIRYFMTIPEAVQLVLQAATMAEQSEVFVLDMGEPVKIIELAENMIRLSGHRPYQDIDIIETGLRSGEKLYEELLIASEDLISTPNTKIFIERQHRISQHEIQQKLKHIGEALGSESVSRLRAVLHEVVPTFKEPHEVNQIFEATETAQSEQTAQMLNPSVPIVIHSTPATVVAGKIPV
ncbi:polysaccharide biosynthesis protein [Oscillospiraceae bacterium LTW-04]|nr:nucleoside-diphosphate sugar epimerase/dehydratase [Oscillospiraceae bacterium MB24-C1]